MERYAARSRILTALDRSKSLAELSKDVGITDARLLWHLGQMREDNQVMSRDELLWIRTPEGLQALENTHLRETGSAFPPRVIDDFNDAMVEAEDGLYGFPVVQARGEHRSRLSNEEASEFRDRLMSLVEEYFAPGQGDQTGIKHGFHWVLTPIDLHPLGDD